MKIPKTAKSAVDKLVHLAVGMMVIILFLSGYIVYQQQVAAVERNQLINMIQEQREQFLNCQNSTPEHPIAGCQEPVADPDDLPVPEGIPGIQGPQGPQGPPGPPPSEEQVLGQVEAFCGLRNDCAGSQGLRGPQGPPPTAEQVFEQVQLFCANGACVGPAGQPGPAGAPGAPGEKGDKGDKGDPGPGPTDEQVAQAVADYCSKNSCVGPQGPAGQDGAPGQPGEPGRPPTADEIAAAVAAYCGQPGNCEPSLIGPGD